jgi:RNA polymerase subunit RPABC4/transcription elongation factor Spt4
VEAKATKKIAIFLICSLTICITLLTGRASAAIWDDIFGGDPFGIEGATTNFTAICGIVIIIVAILVVVLLVGLARAGTKKDITVHTPPPVIVHQESKEPSPPVFIPAQTKEIQKTDRRCPECGRIIPDDAKLCPFCGKKFRTKFIEEQSEDEENIARPLKKSVSEVEITEPSENTIEKEQTMERSKYCPECGQKLKGNPKYCPICGVKQEEF